MLFSLSDRKITEIFGDKGYRFVGDKCKKCCKTCIRHTTNKIEPKHICHLVTPKECDTATMATGFHNIDCVDVAVYPGYVCKKWKPKKGK